MTKRGRPTTNIIPLRLCGFRIQRCSKTKCIAYSYCEATKKGRNK